jgi:RimJ/RimL family protein N-acetyltransferase
MMSEPPPAVAVGVPLPEHVLITSQTLPRKPEAVTLSGTRVLLAPLDLARDAQALHDASNGAPFTMGARHVDAYDADALIWRYMSGGPFRSAEALAAFLQPQVEASDGLCMCVFDRATMQQIGVVNYLANAPAHLKVELGSIWYSPIAQRTGANTEAAYLLLRHAFSRGYRRVEWKCDALNERSRRAALRIGFRFEGIQEQHYIVKGRNRDTAWFRMLDHEWPHVARRLEQDLVL